MKVQLLEMELELDNQIRKTNDKYFNVISKLCSNVLNNQYNMIDKYNLSESFDDDYEYPYITEEDLSQYYIKISN